MSQSGYIDQIFKARKHILEILESRGFDVSLYNAFSRSEVHTMYMTNTLDMQVDKMGEGGDGTRIARAYIKFAKEKILKSTHIYEAIEDLYNVDEILQPITDEFIIINTTKPNDSIWKTLKQLWGDEKKYVAVFHLKELQFNVLNHVLVPPHRVISDPDEEKMILTRYNITNPISELPDISRTSLVAQAIGLRPGQICEIRRPSRTAIYSLYYRVCKD